MATVNIPRDNQDGSQKDSASKIKKQKQYQEALTYELAFQKKKQEIARSASMKQLEEEKNAIQRRYTESMLAAKRTVKSKEELEKQLATMQIDMLYEIARKNSEITAERKKQEYEAHKFASECAMKSMETQNVHQRAKTAARLADEQKAQTAELRRIKTVEIEELRASKKSATSAEEKRKISSEIRRIQREISAAEAQEAKYKQEASKYAEMAKRVDFERLSAADKLASKEKELVSLQSDRSKALSDIDSKIAAKQADLQSASGNRSKSSKIEEEIEQLKSKRSSVSEEYDGKISEVTSSIDAYKKESGTEGLRVNNRAPSTQVETSDDFVEYLSAILNCLTDFNSSFDAYVDALGNSTNTSDNNGISEGSSISGRSNNLSDILRELVDKAAGDDVALQSELHQKLEGLGQDIGSAMKSVTEADKESSKDGAASTMDKVREIKESLRTDKEIDGKTNLQRTQDAHVASKKAEIEKRKADAELRKAQWEAEKNDPELRKNKVMEKAFQKMQQALDGLADMCKSIDTNINQYFSDQAEINAKLQGTGMEYSDALDTLTGNLGMSMLVNQKEYIANLKKVVDAGIVHNLETRTFLATVSDKIVNTFDVFDANLLKLIRIQQNDSTAARLGMESTLNKLFNSYFQDSSYLSGPHDNITGAIIEASSMMTREMSVEFEYMVHKWLGALHSMGVSEDTLQTIAKGLNSLGTGDVSGLSGNESLQTLLAMSANKGGESYADILINGLDAETTNNLLRGMIEYLMEIAKNTDNNQVVKSAYSDLFGLNISDLRAIVNLSNDDISFMSGLSTTYAKSVNETQNQLSEIKSRTHLSTMIETLFENAVLGASLDIGSSPVSYGLWKTLNIIEGLTGGIALPFINVFGSGFDLNTTVTQLAKGAMAGLSMLGNLVSALGSGGVDSGMDINDWNNVEMTARGSASSFLMTGTASGFSSSSRLDYAGSGSSDDVKKTEMSDAADSAEEDKEIINKNQQDTEDVPLKTMENTLGIWQSVAEGEDTIYKQSLIANDHLEDIAEKLSGIASISALLSTDRVFMSSSVDSGVFAGLDLQYSDSGLQVVDGSRNIASAANLRYQVMKHVDTSRLSPLVWSAYVSGNTEGLSTYDQSFINSIKSTDAAAKYAEIQQMNKVIFPDYVVATVDEISPSVKKAINEAVSKAFEAAGYTSSASGTSGEEEVTHPVVRQLTTWLENETNVITVRNSTFGI